MILLQFKAGRCQMIRHPTENKFTVTPEPARGQITLKKTLDNLVSLEWQDRTTQTTEHTWLLLLPGEVDFKKVKTGREGDRIYMLKWKNEEQIMMFWMQEKSPQNDAENCAKFNNYINNPESHPPPPSNPQSVQNGPSPESWMELLG